jgi:hypothetical protein
VLHWDSDNLASDDAVQRNCSHCRKTQMKGLTDRWSGDLDGCPCCEELPAEHTLYCCKRCSHGVPRGLVTCKSQTISRVTTGRGQAQASSRACRLTYAGSRPAFFAAGDEHVMRPLAGEFRLTCPAPMRTQGTRCARVTSTRAGPVQASPRSRRQKKETWGERNPRSRLSCHEGRELPIR